MAGDPLDSLPITYANGDPNAIPERQIDEKLLKAGVEDPYIPMEPIDPNTSKHESVEAGRDRGAPEVFTRNTKPVEILEGTVGSNETKRISR